MNLRPYLLIAAIVANPVLAQQPGTPQKTTEQQARSYVASAFITGAAPVIMSEQVSVSPALRQYLSLPPDADGPATYKAMMNVTSGKPVTVRRAAADEIAQSQAPAPVAEQPIFALEAGSTTLIVQYDLARDNIAFVGLPGAVATAAPVMAPTPPEKMADTPTVVPIAAAATTGTVVAPTPPAAVEAPKPPPAPVAPAPVAEPQQKPLQVVEPAIPRATKPAATTAVAPHPPQPVAMRQELPPPPPLKPSGACVIKPVMSDQDLVNCGATPR
jgi:hypothetical protein